MPRGFTFTQGKGVFVNEIMAKFVGQCESSTYGIGFHLRQLHENVEFVRLLIVAGHGLKFFVWASPLRAAPIHLQSG